ncbi:MAG: hypothetical protein JW963_06070 [Anaerolineales bacterium]|nr:hypothetical protein [Anaerolineales bacterium]
MGKDAIKVGLHRPVYLWAGPGTIRMNRLKFMGAPVDEAVHHEAHTAEGARRMAEAGFTWAYLMYDWGFPPEVEAEDWQDFKRAVENYQAAGMRTFGYIQTSNCVYDGSYKQMDWYARDSRGRLIYYYTGRYMTCWLHPAWTAHLREMVRGVVEAGADGVFFDNPWHAGQPLNFLGAWMGGAGCYCDRCQDAYRQASGRDIPTRLNPERDEDSRTYLRWRAVVVTRKISELAEYARTLKTDALVSVNDFDAVMRSSYLVYGIDLQGLAGVQNLLMIEDFGLPRWEARERLLVNNALTLRTALALAGETPVTTDPYDKGIGFDGVYAPRRFVQGIAEAAACGAPMVVKGTEFVEDGDFTLLTAARFAPQREMIGSIHRWLEEHMHLYEGRENMASIGLLFPGEELWFDWNRLASGYFGIGQALLSAGLPWKVVNAPEHLEGLETLLTFGDVPTEWSLPENMQIIDVLGLPSWELPAPTLLARHDWLRAPVSFVVEELFRAYFHSRLARRLLDGVGLSHFFLQSPFFKLPSADQSHRLLEAIEDGSRLRVRADAPVLIEHWEQGRESQVHLVNYAPQTQSITVEFGKSVHGRVISAGAEELSFEGETFSFELDVYAIILFEAR